MSRTATATATATATGIVESAMPDTTRPTMSITTSTDSDTVMPSSTAGAVATDNWFRLDPNPNPKQRPLLSRILSPGLGTMRYLDKFRISGGAPRISTMARRVYGPGDVPDEFDMHKREIDFYHVAQDVARKYRGALLYQEKLESGYCCCLGLLDPITNIRLNGCIYDAFHAPPEEEPGNVAVDRSVDGLVAFLTALFPHLPEAEALVYLEAVGPDPLVAALVIIDRRRMLEFGFDSATTRAAVEAALGFAAVAAKHPDPKLFVLGWKRASANLKELAGISVPFPDHNAASRAVRLVGTPKSDDHLQLHEFWELARGRLAKLKTLRKELPSARAGMKRILLATIHGSYLKALGCLPQHELTKWLHYSILTGGNCLGPLDPVSNIIVNTIWFAGTFPPSKQVTLTMISTECLWRAAARSLYGLISFLCTRYPELTPDEAIHQLLMNKGKLSAADPRFQHGVVPSEAYVAASIAAFHPEPHAQAEFLGSQGLMHRIKVASELLCLENGRLLSAMDLEILKLHIFGVSSAVMFHKQPPELPKKVTKLYYAHVAEYSGMFWGQHERVTRMVEDALSKFNETMEPKYRLHLICGVNEFVSGPEFSTDTFGDYNPWTPHIYRHSHINFLATREGEHAVLFFAECGNHDTSSWCVPVSRPWRDAVVNSDAALSMHSDAIVSMHPKAIENADDAIGPYTEQVRCIYCEEKGNRIVHPAVSSFHGRDNFVELFETDYKNDDVLGSKAVDWVHDLEDDAIYFNYIRDEEEVEDPEMAIMYIQFG